MSSPEVIHSSSQLPFFDRANSSKVLCRIGLAFCWIVGIVSLGAGIHLSNRQVHFGLDYKYSTFGILTNIPVVSREIAVLLINILVTICNEICGLIHTTSLRWALQQESKLAFNSNLRLFTSSSRSKANAWYTNLLMTIFLILSYVSAPLVFIRQLSSLMYESDATVRNWGTWDTFVCGYALLTLAIALLGQAFVATIICFSAADIKTWSSDPIETTAACIHAGTIQRISDRCLRGIDECREPGIAIPPKHRQKQAFCSHKELRRITHWMWVPVGLGILWTVIMFSAWAADTEDDEGPLSWALLPHPSGEKGSNLPTHSLGFKTWTSASFTGGSFVKTILFIGFVQSAMTLGLHAAELIVNAIRDEATWRKAAHNGRSRSNVLVSMLSSPPALILFLLKPIIHWFYSLALEVSWFGGIQMRPPGVLYLTASGVFLACFTGACSRLWKPKGPQPAAFGHLQTLANLIDEWPKNGEKMYWGHKNGYNDIHSSEAVKVRTQKKSSVVKTQEVTQEISMSQITMCYHAGTAPHPLGRIDFDSLYRGRYLSKPQQAFYTVI